MVIPSSTSPGHLLRVLRLNAGLRAEDVGRATRIDKASISRYENDWRTPGGARRARLAAFYGVPESAIWGDEPADIPVEKATPRRAITSWGRAQQAKAKPRKEEMRALRAPGMSLAAIGARYGVSRQRAHQLINLP